MRKSTPYNVKACAIEKCNVKHRNGRKGLSDPSEAFYAAMLQKMTREHKKLIWKQTIQY